MQPNANNVNIFNDLGFTEPEASNLKIHAALMRAIIAV